MNIVKTVDLSGFEKPPKAVGYEGACQKMLWTGIQFLENVESPETLLKGMKTIDNDRISITGICEVPEKAAELEKAVTGAIDGCSGAQHQFVMTHLKFISENGVTKWLEEFKDQPDRIYNVDLDELLNMSGDEIFNASPEAVKVAESGKKHLDELRGRAVVVDPENAAEEIANVIRAEVKKQEKHDDKKDD